MPSIDFVQSLSASDLEIPVNLTSIIDPERYQLSPPPSTCIGVSGVMAELFECTTTVAPVEVSI